MIGTVSAMLHVFALVFLLAASVSLFVVAPLVIVSLVVERLESR